MRRVAPVAAALLGAGVLSAGAAAAPLAVRASFDMATVQFGAAIGTQVVVVLDGTAVRSSSLHVIEDAGPLTALSPQHASRATRGNSLVVVFRRTFSCLSSACVSANADATPSLPSVIVTVLTRGGRTLRAKANWPTLHVRGVVTKSDLARSRPSFLADTTPAAPSYRAAPSTLAWLLDALAVVLGLAALALAAVVALARARDRGGAPTGDELERALRLAREAEGRAPPDRRRALGLLARVLEVRDRPLAGTANDLAWAKAEPQRESLASLVADVERVDS
jgi:hypothetical protein